MKKDVIGIVVIAVILAVVAFFFIHQSGNRSKVMSEGVDTSVISSRVETSNTTKVRSSGSSRTVEKQYRPVYTYQVDGKTYKAYGSTTKNYSQALRISQDKSTKIRYLKNDPQNSIVIR